MITESCLPCSNLEARKGSNLIVSKRSGMAKEESDASSSTVMANEEGDPPPKDESVIPFLKSLEKKMECNQKVVAMTDDIHWPWGSIPKMDRVPGVLRQQNKNGIAYSPTIISIGPLHRDTRRLQEMEPVKLNYMSSLFKRTANPEETKKDCATAMLKMEEVVRNYYEPNIGNIGLAEVMLVDGCFIIELVFGKCSFDFDVPIAWNPFKCYAVQRDLLLLENQIPFFVLQKLFDLTLGKILHQDSELSSLIFYVFTFFKDIVDFQILEEEKIKNIIRSAVVPYHILHLFHIYYLPPPTTDSFATFIREDMREGRTGINYTATELSLAGVQLKAGKKDRNLFDIKFTTACSCTSCSSFFRKGHLEIPSFSISDSTESFLRNLIAFELSSVSIDSYFTSLAFLMDTLINTHEDVKLFEEAGIIHNNLGTRGEVARLFNGICANATSTRFLYHDQYKEAMKFCNPWRVSTGKLRHHYFGNPWSGISIIAAIFLFALTLSSTIYTILPYY